MADRCAESAMSKEQISMAVTSSQAQNERGAKMKGNGTMRQFHRREATGASQRASEHH